jgi:hypothetical protein
MRKLKIIINLVHHWNSHSGQGRVAHKIKMCNPHLATDTCRKQGPESENHAFFFFFFFFFFFVGAEPGLYSPDALRPVGLLCTA